jgi:hypothetical protein
MRTTDFTLAPKQGQAEAMIVAERRFDSASTARGARTAWRALAAHLSASPGFVWAKTYQRAPLTLGIIAYFADRTQIEAALTALPASLRDWVTLEKLVDVAPSARIFDAEPSGYTNGRWRAEDGTMGHIERFTPTSVEVARGSEPPRVAATSTSAPSKSRARNKAQRPWQPLSNSHAMFLGATKYTGPLALIALSRIYYPMIRRMVTLRGYIWFTTYYEFPFTLGTLAFFERRDDLLAFARMPGHRHLMQWITKDTRNGTAGFIRLHTAPEGDAESEVDVAPKNGAAS